MGTTMSIMTQRLYIAVSFWMFLNIAFVHSTKETPVCPFALKSFQRPEIIILEKLMHLGYKGLVKFISNTRKHAVCHQNCGKEHCARCSGVCGWTTRRLGPGKECDVCSSGISCIDCAPGSPGVPPRRTTSTATTTTTITTPDTTRPPRTPYPTTPRPCRGYNCDRTPYPTTTRPCRG